MLTPMNVFTGGTFDLFHQGHVELFKYCRAIAGENGKVIVSLNTDDFIEQFKGKKPLMTYTEREAVLLSCRYVDLVIPNIGGSDSAYTITEFNMNPHVMGGIGTKPENKINIVVIGSDWHDKDYMKQMNFTWSWLRDRGIALCYVPRVIPISTTKVKERFE
jgi:glycerol-3-phosphate cytidylyltransferase